MLRGGGPTSRRGRAVIVAGGKAPDQPGSRTWPGYDEGTCESFTEPQIPIGTPIGVPGPRPRIPTNPPQTSRPACGGWSARRALSGDEPGIPVPAEHRFSGSSFAEPPDGFHAAEPEPWAGPIGLAPHPKVTRAGPDRYLRPTDPSPVTIPAGPRGGLLALLDPPGRDSVPNGLWDGSLSPSPTLPASRRLALGERQRHRREPSLSRAPARNEASVRRVLRV